MTSKSKQPKSPEDVGDQIALALKEAVAVVTDPKRSCSGTGALFPNGITRIYLRVKLQQFLEAEIEMVGPEHGGNAIGNTRQLDMENLPAPPVPRPKDGDPRPATAADQKRLSKREGTKSIAGAAAAYQGSCTGGDVQTNNCAHYLSDAFIRTGYTELLPDAACINARCATQAQRPIRARDMWCWFKSMATSSQNTVPKNDGLWAVFQLDESSYWGGHVVIIDTDTGTYYGTGNYPDWKQYAYKW